MSYKLQQTIAVLAAALVLTYAGMVAVSDLRDFSPWPFNLLGLAVLSFLCGGVMAASVPRAIWLTLLAAALAVVIFGGLWSYFWWTLLGHYISFSEIALSDYVFLYIAQRGGLMFVITALTGLIGSVTVLAFLPEQYLPKKRQDI
ncbi:MAG: hypothetical protein EXR62_03405 [Chloroflexi bacterium]|nr:hypothetical protein [Chloroflexota bacterium]